MQLCHFVFWSVPAVDIHIGSHTFYLLLTDRYDRTLQTLVRQLLSQQHYLQHSLQPDCHSWRSLCMAGYQGVELQIGFVIMTMQYF
jgi:hypothetical protein